MGTDIYFFAIYKTLDHWEFFGSDFYFGSDRNYPLFAAIAGVRGLGRNIPSIAEPQGLPKDLSAGGHECVARRAAHFLVCLLPGLCTPLSFQAMQGVGDTEKRGHNSPDHNWKHGIKTA